MSALLICLADGKFHSGEQLGRLLGISRSAVWKQLQAIEEKTGLTFFKVPGKGYRLAEPLELLTPHLIKCVDWPVSILDTIDSTNAEALRRVLNGATQPPFVLLAEHQTSGRGRRGRLWVSPYAKNIYLTLALSIQGGVRQLEGLSLVVGLAVVITLRKIGLKDVGLKWPNDILLHNRKLAGVLVEISGDPADICTAIIGIGLNVNMRSAENIDQPWISLHEAIGHPVSRNELVSGLLEELRVLLGLHQEQGFAELGKRWEENHLWQGREVVLSSGVHQVNGTVLGIGLDGSLRLNVDGHEKSFSGGELSLRLNNDS
ncbi:bifunctional biotin--[acetyl-CoA-carboxylase] ligase/biotin operon repressor BirA [Pseudomonas duriflava]|uniref:bifunctional biotin--[acetyl-CoA-carboxylase] ligase/biotin operon repressor BirA n=1 Tax=Pseudomonas duriflava TaxID=459528 RepID=UPI0011A8F2C8|nr:bifunctional biotin--[acetyl-CoA-carboxylase] ligase/biotin operon repressor BirA [Pseudomonas duriflava]